MNSLLAITCLVAAAAVGVTSNAIIAPVVAHIDHPRYAYNYAVNDPHTGDNKAQWEARDGDLVKGSYSLVEPDGTLRVVDYTADDHSGFNAVVKNIGASVHPTPLHHGSVAHGPIIAAPLKPLITPLNYGFGAAPLAIGLPKIPINHWGSLPWDPLTHSYGGWVPLTGPYGLPIGPHATIISKKWINGVLHKKITGPISLIGRKLVINTKH